MAARNRSTDTLAVVVVVEATNWTEPRRTTRHRPPAGTNSNVWPFPSTDCRSFAEPIASCPDRAAMNQNDDDDDVDDVVVVVVAVDDANGDVVIDPTICQPIVAAPVDDQRKKVD